MERVPIGQATFEASVPTLQVVRAVLTELDPEGAGRPLNRDILGWRDRLKDLADRLNEPSLRPHDTFVLIAVSAIAAAEQFEGSA